jgi:hypothetical protein
MENKRIKITAIWRDDYKWDFWCFSYSCWIYEKADGIGYHIRLDDGYDFVCDSIEVVIE